VLLVFGAPGQLQSVAGQEHGRTIPLADILARDQRPTRLPPVLGSSSRAKSFTYYVPTAFPSKGE
jgi:hypothetical protein